MRHPLFFFLITTLKNLIEKLHVLNSFIYLQLTIRASDQGVTPQSIETIASITITRKGNPFFSDNEYRETRSENTPVNSNIIQLQATDPLNVSSFRMVNVSDPYSVSARQEKVSYLMFYCLTSSINRIALSLYNILMQNSCLR